jgi:hypothetical protein
MRVSVNEKAEISCWAFYWRTKKKTSHKNAPPQKKKPVIKSPTPQKAINMSQNRNNQS